MSYFKAAMDEDERAEADRLNRQEKMERDEPEPWDHAGYHWHEGEGHDHPHGPGHHGPPFGKKNVHEVGEPSLELLLHYSIEREEARRDASTT